MSGPRVVEADNAGPFTLGGTRTFIVGRACPAIIDPGPDDPAHLDRIAEETMGARNGVILLTHHHRDHAAGARPLAERLGYPVRGPGPEVDREVHPGERLETDEGTLVAVDTPGHAREHLSYLCEPGRELFAGDLLLGRGSTTWVGAYSGCVAEYLASLDRVEALDPVVAFPAHGPPIRRVGDVVRTFRAHRLGRIAQVESVAEELGIREALAGGGPIEDAVGRILDAVYPPDLPALARKGAYWSVCAMLEYLEVAPFPGPGPEEG